MSECSCQHRTGSDWPYPVSDKTLSIFQRQNQTASHAAKGCAEQKIVQIKPLCDQNLTPGGEGALSRKAWC